MLKWIMKIIKIFLGILVGVAATQNQKIKAKNEPNKRLQKRKEPLF